MLGSLLPFGSGRSWVSAYLFLGLGSCATKRPAPGWLERFSTKQPDQHACAEAAKQTRNNNVSPTAAKYHMWMRIIPSLGSEHKISPQSIINHVMSLNAGFFIWVYGETEKCVKWKSHVLQSSSIMLEAGNIWKWVTKLTHKDVLWANLQQRVKIILHLSQNRVGTTP